MTPLTLYELNRMVSEVLTLSLNDSYWVVAEIAALNEHVSGHCYLELVEKDENGRATLSNNGGKFRAQARATVWRTTWSKIVPRFYRETGQYPAKGMKVLLEVKVTFHEVYGYSLNVSDIDPTYTLGDMARRRLEIIQQLTDDGVIDLNKQLTLPRPLQRIAVISAAGAAGYGDFCQQLDESGFRFATRLFPATMQGADVESSVIHALDAIAADLDNWDCVVIIRGGGAVADLNGFETYLLAANVAQFPLPVFTGIGHERDDTVIDIVAHTRLKTPTAVAQFLIDMMREELDMISHLEETLLQGITTLLRQEQETFHEIAHRFERAASDFTHRQTEHCLRLANRLETASRNHLSRHTHIVTSYTEKLRPLFLHHIERQRHRLELAERAIAMSGPERILKMGYSITTDKNGKVVHSAADVKEGSTLHTQLADGVLISVVKPPKQQNP